MIAKRELPRDEGRHRIGVALPQFVTYVAKSRDLIRIGDQQTLIA
jgi:hypothetical protein